MYIYTNTFGFEKQTVPTVSQWKTMAERKVSSKSLEQLEGEITCGICQEHYTEPKLSSCLVSTTTARSVS